jgi:peroxiredoxin
VQRGRFIYETVFEDTATLMLMFPNFSQIPVFASSGITITLKGDASQLREVKLKGSKENDEMTAFRLKATQLLPSEMKEIAADYIVDEPTSPVRYYLLQQYFIRNSEHDYLRALQLCNVMLKANAHNKPVAMLRKELLPLVAGSIDSRIPPFALLNTKGKPVTNSELRSEVNIICLWASWNYESRTQMKTLRKLVNEHRGHVSALGISLDASRHESRDWLRRDSIDFPLVIDGRMWQTPMVRSLGLVDVPCNIIANKNGRIVARDIPTKDLQKKVEELLNSK